MKKKALKTKFEQQRFKKRVRSLPGYSNTNDEEQFANLQGSNEDYGPNLPRDPQEKGKGEKSARIKKWMKDHLFEEIIAASIMIIIAISAWVITNVIDLREKTAMFEVRIEFAQDKLETINENSATKEFLAQELEILRLQLENAQKRDISIIETKIALIENEIRYLTEQSSKAGAD